MAREALFELAVNRALVYAGRTGELPRTPATMRRALETWYLKTRFAYRIPLDEVIATLLTWPGEPTRWRGGAAGGWSAETPKTP